MMALLVVQGGLVLAVAPLLTGITRRLKARLQYRRGPSILQPYHDLRKLWGKGSTESDASSPLTALAPVMVFVVMLVAALATPMISTESPVSGVADMLVIVGLLALARLVLVLLAFDAGSAFGGMGGSREVAIAALAEPGIILGLAVSALSAGSTDLSAIARHGLVMGPALYGLPILLAAGAFAIAAIAETGHQPVDNPDTHLELTMIHEGMLLEASGRRLAMLTYAGHLKFVVVIGIFMAAFLPFGTADAGVGRQGAEASAGAIAIALSVGVIATVAKLVAASVAVALLDAGLAKLRILLLPSLLGLAAVLGITAVAAALWLPS